MVSPLGGQPFFGGWPHPQKHIDSTEEGLGLFFFFFLKNMMLGGGVDVGEVRKRSGSGYDQNTWHEKC